MNGRHDAAIPGRDTQRRERYERRATATRTSADLGGVVPKVDRESTAGGESKET
jgi:hypothetical protein